MAVGGMRPLPNQPPNIYPYPNISTARLDIWHWGSEAQSAGNLDWLTGPQVLGAPDFNLSHVVGQNWSIIHKALAAESDIFGDAKWENPDIEIQVPLGKIPRTRTRGKSKSKPNMPAPYHLHTKEFHHKKLVSVMRDMCASEASKTFHWIPHALYWQPSSDVPEVRVHFETYNSPDLIEEYRKVQALPRAADDVYERVVMPLIPSSDATHLTSFGSAVAWPGYMQCGLQSKYDRGKPSKHAVHHFAHFPHVGHCLTVLGLWLIKWQLPHDFKERVRVRNRDKKPTSKLHAHCKRELFHRCWDEMLDEEFIEAYTNGVLIECADGITRRVFPRFFAYSADYPEKQVSLSSRRPCADNEFPGF
jgi:hypothetical protein